MQIKIDTDVFIEVSIDYYEPAFSGSQFEPPSSEYIEWSAACPTVQALIGMSEELFEAVDELVYKQAGQDRAESAADAAIERMEYAHGF